MGCRHWTRDEEHGGTYGNYNIRVSGTKYGKVCRWWVLLNFLANSFGRLQVLSRQSKCVWCELNSEETSSGFLSKTYTDLEFFPFLEFWVAVALKTSREFKIQRRDGYENVALKLNLPSFSLCRDYCYPLTLSNVREPSWSWIPSGGHLQVQIEK